MRKDASKDNNFVNTLTAVLNTDGATIVPLQADPVSHHLKVNDGTTGTDNGPNRALRDGNDVPTMLAVSSADLTTPVALYADSSGNLLISN